jgi:pyruvate dehydrogenase E1 component
MNGTFDRSSALRGFRDPLPGASRRRFGMEGMFRQLGIYSSVGQLYRPQDADQLMYYREDKSGQVLQEGINEGGAMSSWIVAATSYSTNNADDPILHLLFDVRSAARRRPPVAGR